MLNHNHHCQTHKLHLLQLLRYKKPVDKVLFDKYWIDGPQRVDEAIEGETDRARVHFEGTSDISIQNRQRRPL